MDGARLIALIQSAIDESYENFTTQEVIAEIEAGRSALFAGRDSFMVATLHRHHDELTGHAWLGGGDLDELRDVIRPQSEAWAKENGARYATIEGRRGWVRALKQDGYREVSVTVRKTL